MRGLLPAVVAAILYLALVLVGRELSFTHIAPAGAALGGAVGGWIIARHAPSHAGRWVAAFVVLAVGYTLYPVPHHYWEGRNSYVNALLLSALLTIVAAPIAAYLQRVAAPAAPKETTPKTKRR